MRSLVYIALGVGSACALWVYVVPQTWILPLLLGMVLLATLLAVTGKKRTAMVALGISLGLLWCGVYSRMILEDARQMDGVTREETIHISDYSEETAYGVAAEGRMTLSGKTYLVRVYLNREEPLSPGMQVQGTFLFRSTVPGGTISPGYYTGKGIYLLAYQRGEVICAEGEKSLLDAPARMRWRICSILENSFAEDTAPFAKALLLGETSDLDYETDTDLKISGIRHIIAVSGLHISILFGALEMLTFRKRYLTALVGLPGLFFFAALAGFSPSVSRACVMVALMLLARLLNRDYDGPTALAFAALGILTLNPMAISSVSFQLSFASVAGIFLFSPGIQKWVRSLFGEIKQGSIKARLVGWFSSSVSVTLSAMALTSPLCAWYFGMVSLIGVVTNLLTLWVISILFYGLLTVCLVYPIWHLGAEFLGWILGWLVRCVLLVAKILADFPLAAVYTSSPYIVAWLVFVYGLLVVFLASRNRRPALLGSCACVGLCLALLGSWMEPALDNVRLTVLDVGQGQCILLQSGGCTFMVDCGGDSDTGTADLAAQTLLGQGIHRLDGMILTHCDRDHAGGAEYFLSRMDTQMLIQPENGEISGAEQIIYAAEELRMTFGDATLTIYPPTFPGDSNETSLCVLFETENCDILITGDRSGFGERSLLRNARIGDVDVLIAGHHGSKYATCEELLEAVQPEIVCISAGRDNSYGHPAQETLDRLSQFGCSVYRTDQLGTITIRR